MGVGFKLHLDSLLTSCKPRDRAPHPAITGWRLSSSSHMIELFIQQTQDGLLIQLSQDGACHPAATRYSSSYSKHRMASSSSYHRMALVIQQPQDIALHTANTGWLSSSSSHNIEFFIQ
ncbi:hypothetical protein J6590_052500 [Homalodisca vitripennis]|nr:hypothetical protein J6590_052500 [Homalodisca vitripennis]